MANLEKGFILQFHITERCNLRCKHCYQEDKYLNQEMTLEQKKNVIDMFGKAAKAWAVKGIINFTGGEPLIKKQELLELIRYAKSNYPGMVIGILSNGTLIDKTTANELKAAGVKDVQVSLDGATEETHDLVRGKGNFKKAIEGIKNIVSVGLLGEIMFTLHKQNAKEVPAIIDLAASLGAKRIGIERLVPIGRGSKELPDSVLTPEELHNVYAFVGRRKSELKDKIIIATNRPLWCLVGQELEKTDDFVGSCAAGLSTMTVLPNGDVMPCRRMNLVIGNLKEKSLFDIWYSTEILWKLREKSKSG